MKRVTSQTVAKLVKDNNASGEVWMSFYWSGMKQNYNVHFSNGATLTFEDSQTANKVFTTLKTKLKFAQVFNFNEDR